MKNPYVRFLGTLVILIFFLANEKVTAQEFTMPSLNLPSKYEELTALEFVQAVARAKNTCIIPIGILEKHGPHLPLGTDLINIREIALRATKQEYSVVFPDYYFGQIYEAKHQPGTIAYSPELIWDLLQETCNELARNGFKKIILVNGHGGNNNFLHYFCQAQLANNKDYAVVLFSPENDSAVEQKIKTMRRTTTGGHADEIETSMMLAHRPELAHVNRGRDQSGADLNRLRNIPYGYTGIWWYAKFPNHYAGDGSQANRELGELVINNLVSQLVALIKAVKIDENIHELQQQFFKDGINPLNNVQ